MNGETKALLLMVGYLMISPAYILYQYFKMKKDEKESERAEEMVAKRKKDGL